jgi:hypothetical protein
MFLNLGSREGSDNCFGVTVIPNFRWLTNYVNHFILNLFQILNLQSEGISEHVLGGSTITN